MTRTCRPNRWIATIALTCGLALSGALTGIAMAKLKVATSFTILADMARNVAGEHADIVSITKPGAEIHNYQPTPGDIMRAQGTDLILYNGLNLERWFDRFFNNLSGVERVVLTEGVEPMSIDSGPYSGKPNPHAWMSPSAGVIYVENIRKALVAADPENAPAYDANAARYKAEIEALATPIRAELATIPSEKRWLATSEGAFSYLARDFELKELYLWPINADQQGTPQQVRKVIDAVRENEIPVVFSESTVSPKPAQQVARETGAAYGGVLYVDSLSDETGPVPTYLDLIRITSRTIAEGLTGKAAAQ